MISSFVASGRFGESFLGDFGGSTSVNNKVTSRKNATHGV
jgi:hypothetical protein